MITLIGHEKVREALENELPSVALLRGPTSVGKWTLAEYLIQYHDVLAVDVKRVEKLSVDVARELQHFCNIAPFGKFKVIVIQLDGSSYSPLRAAGEVALNAMLKTLEEPPPSVRFILISSRRTLLTIESRAHIFNCGLLTEEDVREVLIKRMGMLPREADIASSCSRGTIQGALDSDAGETARAKVLSVLKAVGDKDRDLLYQATRGSRENDVPAWDAPEHALLMRWVTEAISGRWSVFTEAETYGLTKDETIPKRMLQRLSAVSNVRPKLAVRAALEPLMERK